MLDDGTVDVYNYAFNPFGTNLGCVTTGTAKVVDTGKLFVNFDNGDTGDYWVVALGPENSDGFYSWSAVSQPDRKNLYILSREKAIDEDVFDDILGQLNDNGFNTTDVVLTGQACDE